MKEYCRRTNRQFDDHLKEWEIKAMSMINEKALPIKNKLSQKIDDHRKHLTEIDKEFVRTKKYINKIEEKL